MRYNLSISDEIAEVITKEAEKAGMSDLDIIRNTLSDKFEDAKNLVRNRFKAIRLKKIGDYKKVVSCEDRKFLLISEPDCYDTFSKFGVIEIPQQLHWMLKDDALIVDGILSAMSIGGSECLICQIVDPQLEIAVRHQSLEQVNPILNLQSVQNGKKFTIVKNEVFKELFTVMGDSNA